MSIKSILYNNSDALVDGVFKILEYIFDVNLSNFVDVKREDFLFKKNEHTFIGEIKGINTNVKNNNISQVDNHCLEYLDNLQDSNIKENIKKILIINYERTKPIYERDEINTDQINIAIKRDVLIITTMQLLKIYEALLKEMISKEDVIKYIIDNIGVANII